MKATVTDIPKMGHVWKKLRQKWEGLLMTKIGDGAQIHVTENRSQATLYRCEFSEGFFFRLCSWFWFWFLTEETLLSRRAPNKEALPNPTDQRLPVLILTPQTCQLTNQCMAIIERDTAGWGSTAFAGSSGFLISKSFSSKAFAEHRIQTADLPFGSRASWPVDHRGSSISKVILNLLKTHI